MTFAFGEYSEPAPSAGLAAQQAECQTEITVYGT